MKIKLLLLNKISKLLFVFILSHSLNAQKNDSIKGNEKGKLSGIPIIFYLPETNFGFGGMINYSFNLGVKDSTSISSVKFGIAYTLNKQWIIHLPFDVFTKENNYYFKGEFGYYIYTYNYYGKGHTEIDYEENYSSTFPRIDLFALKKYGTNTRKKINKFIGPRYRFEQQKITNYIDTGRFAKNEVFGSKNNRTSSIGVAHVRDSRDNILFPSQGIYELASIQYDHPYFGSNFKYFQMSYDFRKYIYTSWKDIVALNFYTEFNFGNVPFNQLAMIGGTQLMRGYYRGRYRDNNILAIQAAYRKHLFWRIGAEVFTGIGSVFNNDEFENIKRIKFTVGGGLRLLIDKYSKLNLRIDYGWAPNSHGIYFTLAEAF